MEFKRCCCCIPLRYGLLISGYLKLVALVAILPLVTTEMVESGKAFQRRDNVDVIAPYVIAFTTIALAILVILSDIAMTIVFVVGSQKKNASLLKICYSYSIGLLVLYILALGLYFAYGVYQLLPQDPGVLDEIMMLNPSIFLIVNICLQVFINLLNKSEIAKLENNCQFQFTNNDNVAQCTMNDAGVNETNETCIINSI